MTIDPNGDLLQRVNQESDVAATNSENASSAKESMAENDAKAKSDPSPNPFDPASLRLSGTSTAGIGVKRVLNHVRCQKPNKQEFIRIHPSEDYRLETAVLQDKTQREDYLVAPALWDDLASEITPTRLVTAITRHDTLFLWPATLPSVDGKSNRWHESMLEAQQHAIEKWVRVQADMSANEYVLYEATGNFPEPNWPDLTFEEILKLAFKTRFIDSMDHAFLRALRGEV